MSLNQYQKEAVDHLDGPCLVTSCPGSGKTLTLVERIIALINHGVKPSNILAITFTNKAANEMRERVCKKLEVEKPGFFIGTFHSLCAKILRKIGPGRGYSSNFTILDERDQIDLVSQVARHLEHDIKYGDARNIAHVLNFYRDQMEDFSFVENELKIPAKIEIAEEYLQRCRKNSTIDFSGLISEAIRIIEENNDIKEKIQQTFKYILVDETQDTNVSQFYLVNLLGGKWKNIMLIGDIDQCIMEGEKVSTVYGPKEIEKIKPGDVVLSAGGGGKILKAKVKEVYKKDVIGYNMVRVTTMGGKRLNFSKEHMVFADYTKKSPKKIIVYLMYDRKYGYRVGVTNTKRKNGAGGCSLGARLSQERADCMWILKVTDSIDDAKYWEQYFSVKYGIPTWCFYNKSRGLDYSDESIEKLFSFIDTEKNAAMLMKDFQLFEERPHYVPKCMSKNKRRNFTINMCADSRYGTLHRYMISGSDDGDRDILKRAGLNVRDAGKGKRGWRVDSAFKSLKDIYNILKSIEGCFPVNVIEKARLGEESLSLIPASHLREGMAVYVEKDGRIELDYVDKVMYFLYNGYLYDLDVEKYHNFITNGIVSHNSIYGWRGARYQNIQEFMGLYPDCKVISLSKNYRSTPQIIKVADRLIKRNTSHMKTKFETDNKNGEPVKCYSFGNQLNESEWVANMIKKLRDELGWDAKDIAVLYRVNKMSEPIEQSLTNSGIPYEVVGSWNFYDRKEARDCISMMKLMVNDKDAVSFHRVASLLKGMGNVTIGKIEKEASSSDISLIDACLEIKKQSKSVSIKKACQEMYDKYHREWDHSNPAVCLSSIIEELRYPDYLNEKFGSDATERMDNVTQIIDACGEFNGTANGLDQYLQQVSLITNNDKEIGDNKVSLMSLHAAKGLEFPIVFIIGVEDGILPHRQAVVDDPVDGMEEERRLLYVGLTRAKKALYVTWCRNRRKFGSFGAMSYKSSKPSTFLKECGLMSDENGE